MTLPLSGKTAFAAAKKRAGRWHISRAQRAHLSRYVVASKKLNMALNYDVPLTPRLQRHAAALDAALLSAPRLSEPLALYRGERWPRSSPKDGHKNVTRRSNLTPVPGEPAALLAWAQSTFPVGSVLEFKGYASFSASVRVAMNFTSLTEKDRPTVLFRARSTHFAHTRLAGALGMGESDVIFPRGTTARVIEVSLEQLTATPKVRLRHRKVMKRRFVIVDVDLELP